ncbi:hypothetical protein BC826DRAFT_629986 [Russula brevipes]|nr:hypothetical protein BC826DRAFT_629986 [Russula brevipes]
MHPFQPRFHLTEAIPEPPASLKGLAARVRRTERAYQNENLSLQDSRFPPCRPNRSALPTLTTSIVSSNATPNRSERSFFALFAPIRFGSRASMVFQTSTHLNLVMDYAEDYTLWDVLESTPLERIEEVDLRWLVQQAIQ